MNENQFAILRGCCQNYGDWPRWDILSDAFRDEGDDVGADWALWVKEKRRWPFRSRTFSLVKNESYFVWHWSFQYVTNFCRFDGLPAILFDSVGASEGDFLYSPSSTSTENAFIQLLNGWRSLTDDKRLRLWQWKFKNGILMEN